MSYTKQVSHQTKIIQKQKFITALVKGHSSSDMWTIKKAFNNIKYQTNTELSNQHRNNISINKTLDISWESLGTHKSYTQSCKRCLLSQWKARKYMVANYDSKEGLNDVTLSHVKKNSTFFCLWVRKHETINTKILHFWS